MITQNLMEKEILESWAPPSTKKRKLNTLSKSVTIDHRNLSTSALPSGSLASEGNMMSIRSGVCKQSTYLNS